MEAQNRNAVRHGGIGRGPAATRLCELLLARQLTEAVESMGRIGRFEWDLARDRLESCSEQYARIFGSSVDEVMAWRDGTAEILARIHPDDRIAYANSREDLIARRPTELRYRVVDGDGELRHVRELGVPITDGEGRAKGIYGLVQDITEQTRFELEQNRARGALESVVRDRTRELGETVERLEGEIKRSEGISVELEKRNAELERFVYTLSHELKSPLVSIRVFSGLLARDISEDEPDRIAADLAKIDCAAKTMQNQVEGLLELYRVGHVVGERVRCDLSAIARAAAAAAFMVESQGIEVEIGDMPAVLADEARIAEVFLNLIENAAKFMGAQKAPRIRIGATGQEDAVACWVEDNGMGIAAEHAERIFDLFERLHNEFGGTGVGLTLARRIVEVHGGEIWVESEGPGRGSRFVFTLPAAPATEDPYRRTGADAGPV